MRFLISFVNSPLSLGGFDWDSGKLFWRISSDRLRACSICYDGESLLVSSDDELRRFTPTNHTKVQLPGPYPSQGHSVHLIDKDTIGVADTGNSVIRLFSSTSEHLRDLAPVADWPQLPHDAIHLNDFAVTPHGIIASCFDIRPWRSVQARFGDRKTWSTSGLGVLLNVSDGNGSGRVIGCGLDHPHTLVYRSPYLFNCSSSHGTFHRWKFTDRGTMLRVQDIHVTQEHFLRGACCVDNIWYLGGSTPRHTQPLCHRMAVYRLDEASGTTERKLLPIGGEIYDILPWRENVMHPVIRSHFGDSS